jgi:hypothetical protein
MPTAAIRSMMTAADGRLHADARRIAAWIRARKPFLE